MKKMVKKMKELRYEKYMSEIEAHAGIILQICKDYGKEVGEALATDYGEDFGNIARTDAEKAMLLGVARYLLDSYMESGK
ncbi:unnamed protein product [marine sediment metagenome]|uniref:Uncharacterized protein n=1 Tax=marine sediment metagenome TaxID=412755 RepID=X1EXZ1_9ZZZZ